MIGSSWKDFNIIWIWIEELGTRHFDQIIGTRWMCTHTRYHHHHRVIKERERDGGKKWSSQNDNLNRLDHEKERRGGGSGAGSKIPLRAGILCLNWEISVNSSRTSVSLRRKKKEKKGKENKKFWSVYPIKSHLARSSTGRFLSICIDDCVIFIRFPSFWYQNVHVSI